MDGIFWETEKKKKIEILGSREALKSRVQQQLRDSPVQKNLLAATQFQMISSSYADSVCSLSI